MALASSLREDISPSSVSDYQSVPLGAASGIGDGRSTVGGMGSGASALSAPHQAGMEPLLRRLSPCGAGAQQGSKDRIFWPTATGYDKETNLMPSKNVLSVPYIAMF
jgi:hypothetical protein